MALMDVFYPELPGLRRRVAELSVKLTTLMESNFKRTNDLIDCVHKYIPGKTFSKIRVDHDVDLGYNCRVIKSRLREISEYLNEKVATLKSQIDGSLFDKIMSVDTSFVEKFRLARKAVLYAEVALGVASIVVMGFICGGAILVTIAASVGVIATCVLAGLAFGVLILAVDALYSLFAGPEEIAKLRRTIRELEGIISEYEPASRKFNKGVERLLMEIEDMYE